MQVALQLGEADYQAIASEVAKQLLPVLRPQVCQEGQDVECVFDVKALAKYLRVSRDWIYKKVAERALPFARVGRSIKFRKHEIDRWLAKQEVAPVSTNPADIFLEKHKKRAEDS
jgi:excisionase family DNA binding protein